MKTKTNFTEVWKRYGTILEQTGGMEGAAFRAPKVKKTIKDENTQKNEPVSNLYFCLLFFLLNFF